MALATFESVVKRYGSTHALGPIDLEIPEGSVGLLGPNGAGKTTMLRLMMGTMPPTEGSVTVLGEPTTADTVDLRRRIGYLPEGEAYFPDLTGVESVVYAGQLVGMSAGDAMSRAHRLLDYVDLGEARYRTVEGYSTGMRQRLKLAQALIQDPELVILDEPTEGVDPDARPRLLELIRSLEAEHDLQLLVSSHLLHDVERLADHVIVLDQGEVVGEGAIPELKGTDATLFEVRVRGSLDPLADHLDEAGISYERVDPNLHIQADSAGEVLRLVADAGCTIRHLGLAETSLADAFAELVGGGRVG